MTFKEMFIKEEWPRLVELYYGQLDNVYWVPSSVTTSYYEWDIETLHSIFRGKPRICLN